MIELENEFVRFWLTDGILYSKYTKTVSFDVNLLKQLIEIRHTISNNTSQYWCYNIGGGVGFPKECRDYADIHGQEFLFATGVVINSHIQKFLFNAYLKLNKPKTPLKAFTNTEKAVEWLNALKLQNKQCLTI